MLKTSTLILTLKEDQSCNYQSRKARRTKLNIINIKLKKIMTYLILVCIILMFVNKVIASVSSKPKIEETVKITVEENYVPEKKEPEKLDLPEVKETRKTNKPKYLSVYEFPEYFEIGAVVKKINAIATTYIPGNMKSCGKTNAISASGVHLGKGAKGIAVDPKVIPLGSLVYVKSTKPGVPDYGYAIAVDTGGAIKGNKIDVATYDTNKKTNPFYTRWAVEVYILDPSKIEFYKDKI